MNKPSDEIVEDENEIRELEIDSARENFENSCRDIVAGLTGWDDIHNGSWLAFDYDEVIYLNNWVNACWQSYIKGRQFKAGSKII